MRPLKRCKMKLGKSVVLTNGDCLDDDDDDCVIIDYPETSHHMKGVSSEHKLNRKVSPQSVIRIDVDDDDENFTKHLTTHDEEEDHFDFESDATLSQMVGHARSGRNGKGKGSGKASNGKPYRLGEEEFELETGDDDSDCEVMEDSSGKLREQWEKAALERKLNAKKAHFGPGNPVTASFSNTSDVKTNGMTNLFFEGPSNSYEGAFHFENFTFEVNPPDFNQHELFPEFDWMNLGRRPCGQKPKTSEKRQLSKENNDPKSKGTCYEELQSPGKSSNSQPKTETSTGHKMKPSSNEEDNSCDKSDHGKHFSTIQCPNCIYQSECACGRNAESSVEKAHLENKHKTETCRAKSNLMQAASGDRNDGATEFSLVDIQLQANADKNGSQEKDNLLEKECDGDAIIKEDSYLRSNKSAAEFGFNHVPDGDVNNVPPENGLLVSLQTDIINEKDKLKETEEYKRTQEAEWASRQQQLKLQAEEAQEAKRMLKRKKAEKTRLLDMERRQKLRLEEVRATQKQDADNLNQKEQLRSEIVKELKIVEQTSFDMASLLRKLGVRVDGGAHPSMQQVSGAYKRALLLFHPDRASGSALRQQVEAEEKFKLISRMKEKYKIR